jgi:hypothetical protein
MGNAEADLSSVRSDLSRRFLFHRVGWCMRWRQQRPRPMTGPPSPQAASPRGAAGGNGVAEEVQGLAVLNAGGDAQVSWISCPSSGNCAAIGEYRDGSGQVQAFIVSEVNGTWEQAAEFPESQFLNTGKLATAVSVSCASPGNCGAGGFYTDSSEREHPFVANEVNGTWRDMQQAPDSAAFGSGGVASISCPAPGNCVAGGYGTDSGKNHHAFILSEANGTWETARAASIPGGPNATSSSIDAVSCASVGNCSAVGAYAVVMSIPLQSGTAIRRGHQRGPRTPR